MLAVQRCAMRHGVSARSQLAAVQLPRPAIRAWRAGFYQLILMIMIQLPLAVAHSQNRTGLQVQSWCRACACVRGLISVVSVISFLRGIALAHLGVHAC